MIIPHRLNRSYDMAVIPKTVREQLAWSYANLARAHAALEDGVTNYLQIHHIIRSKLYRGLITESLSMRSLFDDERLKMTASQACYYCGSKLNLAVDHMIPRLKGGPDEADNLIWACRACNSSKQGRDMLFWMQSKGAFPPLLLLRRYLKLAARHCASLGCLDTELSMVSTLCLPFDVLLLPDRFPPLPELTLWVHPKDD